MTQPAAPPSGPPKTAPAFERVRWKLGRARAALVVEDVWPRLWPALGVGLGGAVAALFDLPALLPGWLHGILLLAWIGAVGGLGWRSLRRTRLPTLDAGRRRIERDNGLAHRPLSTLTDRPVGGDPLAAALWAAHQARVTAGLGPLRVALPRAGWLSVDPLALRALLLLLLLIGLIDAGPDRTARLLRAIHPRFGTSGPALPLAFDLWITPPAYTGLAPTYLGTGGTGSPGSANPVLADQPVAVPAGSTVLAQLHGSGSAPRLVLDAQETAFTAAGGDDWSATTTITDGHRLAIKVGGRTVLSRPLQVVVDQPPMAELTQPPQPTARGALRLDWRATDDYGVKSVAAEIRRPGNNGAPLILPLPTPSEAARSVHATSFKDLLSHPWAGLPVEIRIIARDALDQEGASAPARLVLPERRFRQPVARAVAEQRKQLILHPDETEEVAETLSDLSLGPDHYNLDLLVFTGLRAAADRLFLGGGEAIESVEPLLWDLALRIEDGGVSDSLRAVREAQEALQTALDRQAPDQEIDKLMANLRQAIDQYLRAMTEEAQRRPDGQRPPDQGERMVGGDEIARALDRAQQMAHAGAREAARDALAQLQNLLESLKGATGSRAREGGQGRSLMQSLQRRQQQLLDRSFQGQQGQGQPGQGQQGQNQPGQGQRGSERGGKGGGDPHTAEGLARDQQQLKADLDGLRERLGEAESGSGLDRAGDAMARAADALRRGQTGEAAQAQTEALQQLREAAGRLARRFGQRNSDGGEDEANGRDPFGREGGGLIDQGDVQLPEALELQRSREILDELRRRAGDRDRPQEELDYIERLLRRF